MAVTNDPRYIPDSRNVSEMNFGYEAQDRAAEDQWVRATLARVGVAVGEDITERGCTGFAKDGLSVEEIARLRMGLAGSGAGLPCYVNSGRFCLAHNTIGGLQEKQEPQHPEAAAGISRPLSAGEQAHVSLVQAARRKKGTGRQLAANELLTGSRDDVDPDLIKEVKRSAGVLPYLSEYDADGSAVPVEAATDSPVVPTAMPAQDWRCPDHAAPNWSCRYCVAAEIVHKGPFEPQYAMLNFSEEGATTSFVAAEAIEQTIALLDLVHHDEVTLYVRAACWTRKLSRE